MKRLFTVANFKTREGERKRVKTLILHLAPSSLGGPNICPMATPQCIKLCLNTAGRGVFEPVQAARLRRTALYHADRKAFTAQLEREIANAHSRLKRDWTLAVRINGTSDLPALAGAVAKTFLNTPRLKFYDYTKIAGAMLRDDGVHRTFSRSELNETVAKGMLLAGYNVAVVFATKKLQKLPTQWHGRTVVDGDLSDLRFRDPTGGYVIGLRAKGPARRHVGGFVVAA